MIEGGLGIDDATEEEIDRVKAWKSSGKTWLELAYVFADMVSRRALIGVSLNYHIHVVGYIYVTFFYFILVDYSWSHCS